MKISSVCIINKNIDECLHECIAAGLSQLVIIGAGFDTRAYRFEEVKEIVEGLLMDLKMQNITYRRAGNRDSEVIKNILKETFEEYGINLPANYSFSDIENLEEEYLNASGEFIVLIKKYNIIGFFALLPSQNNQIELKRLYLIASQRGKGLGKSLLNMALQVAKTSGYNRIHLETTSKFVEAVALYRKFGFVKNVEAKLAQGHDIGFAMDLFTDQPA